MVRRGKASHLYYDTKLLSLMNEKGLGDEPSQMTVGKMSSYFADDWGLIGLECSTMVLSFGGHQAHLRAHIATIGNHTDVMKTASSMKDKQEDQLFACIAALGIIILATKIVFVGINGRFWGKRRWVGGLLSAGSCMNKAAFHFLTTNLHTFTIFTPGSVSHDRFNEQ